MEARAPSPLASTPLASTPLASSMAAAAARPPKRSRDPEPDPAPGARRPQPLTRSVGQPHHPSASHALTPSPSQHVRQSPDGAPPPPSFLHSRRSTPAFAASAADAPFAHEASRALAADGKAARRTDAPAAPARPPLLDFHPVYRTEEDYKAYFAAGGTLAGIPRGERDPLCCKAAIAHDPRSLRDVPLMVRLRHPTLCIQAVQQDGYALESVPGDLLARGSGQRELLCDLAYASPRPPRARHVPPDLLTEERAIRSLQWAPRDLRDIPEDRITTAMCLAAIRHTPELCMPELNAIPRRLRDGHVARALFAHSYMMECSLPPEAEWYTPETVTPEFIREVLLLCPDEIHRRHFLPGPVPLDLLAAVLEKYPGCLAHLQAVDKVAQYLLESAHVSGFKAGDVLPEGRWPAGVLPRDLSPLHLTRWAVARTWGPRIEQVPAHLRKDPVICRTLIGRCEASALPGLGEATLLLHLDAIESRLERQPKTLSYLPQSVIRRLDPDRIQSACQALLQQEPSLWELENILQTSASVLGPKLCEQLSAILVEGRARQRAQDVPKPSSRLKALLASAQTPAQARALCEEAVQKDGWTYTEVPKEHRSWPLLLEALRSEPLLLTHAIPLQDWLPGGLTEAMCVEAVEKRGVTPADIPKEIRMRPTFRAALRALPSLHFSEESLRESIAAEFNGRDPDPVTVEWIDRLVQENPERARSIARFTKLDWALTAHHLGMGWQEVWDNISDPAIQADFLAEIGPFTATMEGPVVAAGRAGGAGSSSSSSAAASSTHPS